MTLPRHKVPADARIEDWDGGDYVHAQAGEEAEEWVISVTGPVHAADGKTTTEAKIAKAAVRAALEVVRERVKSEEHRARAIGKANGRRRQP